jgi:hypothetical protein
MEKVSSPLSQITSTTTTATTIARASISSIAFSSVDDTAVSPRRSLEKISSWSHPVVHAVGAPGQKFSETLLSPQLSPQGIAQLEDVKLAMNACQLQLSELEAVANFAAMPGWSRLCNEFASLAGEALECACSRNVPGAMDVFEEATGAIERLACLVEKDSHIVRPHVRSAEATCGCFAVIGAMSRILWM